MEYRTGAGFRKTGRNGAPGSVYARQKSTWICVFSGPVTGSERVSELPVNKERGSHLPVTAPRIGSEF